VWQDTIDLETEKSKPIRRPFSILRVQILNLNCLSATGDCQIVEAVDDWSAKGCAACNDSLVLQ